MLKNYLKVAVRNLIRQKLYVAVNVAGLAIALAVCLLITGYVNNELTFEHAHLNRDRIYRVDGFYNYREGKVSMANIMPALGPALENEFSEVERMVRLRRFERVPVEIDKGLSFVEKQMFAAEPALFEIFTLPLKYGNPETALDAPYSVVISQDISRTYFPDINPIGRMINFDERYDCRVTGVLDEFPVNTQIYSDFIVSYATLEKMGMDVTSWDEVFLDYTYLLLNGSADPKAVEAKIPAFLTRHMEPEEAEKYELQLQQLKDIYLNSYLSNELEPNGNLETIYVFICIGVMILLIATINFVNLTTARTSHRLKEVGVRKAVGASRVELVKQFLSESMLMTVISMIMGLLIFEITRPMLENYIGRPLVIDIYRDPIMILSMISMLIVVGIFSGSYPAFILSRLRPSLIFRSGAERKSTKSVARRVLIAFQFTIAIGLLSMTFAIYKQIDFSLTSDLGFDKENIMMVDLEENFTPEQRRLIKDEIVRSGAVISATVGNDIPGEERQVLYWVRPENSSDKEPTVIHGISIDPDYSSTFALELLEGRNLTYNPTDLNKSVLINEAAVKEFKIENPIGFKFFQKNGEFTVVGVIKDYHVHSMRHEIYPHLFLYDPDYTRIMALKLPGDNINESVVSIQDVWNKVFPDRAMEYVFLDDKLKENYVDEKKTGYLFTTFSFLAVLIACLGIFGLSAYMAEQRTKEIGIRKVLGASLSSLTRLLSKEFFVLVIVANVIAWPLAWKAIEYWLQKFVYRTEISWYVFILSGLTAMFIALMTAGYQAVRAVRANPVDTLKYE